MNFKDIIELSYNSSKIIANRWETIITSNNLKTWDKLFYDLYEKCYEITTNEKHELLMRFANNGKNYEKYIIRVMKEDEIMNHNEDEINVYEITITDIVLHVNLNNIINTSLSQNDLNELCILNEFIKGSEHLTRMINEKIYKQLKQDLPKINQRKGHEEQNKQNMLNYCLNEFNNTSPEMINIVHDYMRNLKRLIRINLSLLEVIKEMMKLTTIGDGSFIPNVLTDERTIKTIDLNLINHSYYFAGVIISYDLRKIEQSKAIKHQLFKFISCLSFNYDESKLNNLTYINAKTIKIFGCWNGITDINRLYGFNNRTIKRHRENTRTGFDNCYINWQIYWINEMMKTQKQDMLCYMLGGEFNILPDVPYKNHRESFEKYAERVHLYAKGIKAQEELRQQQLINDVDDDIKQPHPHDDFDDFIDY